MDQTGDAMTKSYAANHPHPDYPASTNGFEEKTVIADNDPVTHVSPNKVEELRNRIRAARLETMMARKLENELSIDPVALQQVERIADTPENHFSKTRKECELMIRELGEQASTLLSLADRSCKFLGYLENIDPDSNENTTLELPEEPRRLPRKDVRYGDSLAVIERQTQQIDALESMHERAKESYEATLSRLKRENATFKERYETAALELEKANETVSLLDGKLRDQDKSLSQAQNDLDEISAECENTLNELSSLQARYDELNKKSLENQGQHYSKINELEELVRELQANLDAVSRERDNLSTELETCNSLLKLHEDPKPNPSSD